jgi:diguanylate cyclase (GGDEF)-like protein
MFELDARTVIFVNFIYTLSISLFMISSAVLKKHRFKGLLNWIAAFLLLSLNFLILSLRGIIPVNIVIIVPHLCAIGAYIEIKRGLTLFYGIRNRIFTDIFIFSLFALLLIINDTDARLRIVTVSLASILIYSDTILLLRSRKIKSKVIPVMFLIAVFIMFIRLILGIQWDPAGDPLESGNNLSTISILFSLTNILIFFSLYSIVVNRILDERNDLINKIRSESLTDELTGMMNRRGFNRVTKYEMNRFSRTNIGFTFVFCDVDFFKKVNDDFGHECGDEVLRIIGQILTENMRGGETTARWGGEEFVLFFPETSLINAQIALERIKDEIETYSFHCNGHSFHKTMSFGVCFCENPEIEIEQVIKKADENLYKAKESGRNRIIGSVL